VFPFMNVCHCSSLSSERLQLTDADGIAGFANLMKSMTLRISKTMQVCKGPYRYVGM
jgi:hypothetical protein